MQVSISHEVFAFWLVMLEEYFSLQEKYLKYLKVYDRVSWIYKNVKVYLFKIPEMFVLSVSVD